MDIIGKLEVLNLIDIIQMLSMTKRNGSLLLKKGPREGLVYIKEGRVVDASFERWRGVSAVNKLLAWKEGSFEFHEGAKSPGETIQLGTNNLLLEGLRRLDEWGALQEGAKSGKVRFCVHPEAKKLASQGVLNEEEKKFLSFTDGRHALQEIAQKGNFPTERALEIAGELYLAGILDTEEALKMEVEIPTVKRKEGLSRQELQEIIDYLKSN